MPTDAPPTDGLTLVIPVLNPGRFAGPLAGAVAAQTRRPDQVVVLDSESTDGSLGAFAGLGAEVHRVPRAAFDHGGTRALGARLARGRTLVYLTQDALPAPDAFAALLAALGAAPDVGAAYGRHLPRPGASPCGAHLRRFAYPGVSHVRRAADVPRLGLRAAFLSDSFAAYRRDALEAVGGFPARIVMGEDMHVAARLLRAGWGVAYAAEAVVEHSHDHRPTDELRQCFDTGVMHAEERWLLRTFGRPDGSAARFAWSELAYLRRHGVPAAVPRWAWRNAARLAGYRLGRAHRLLPRAVARRLSANPAYWRPAAHPPAPPAACPSAA